MANFSVIIPNYNHGAFLKERIDSVLAQLHAPSEIIILDDHSGDNSHEIIESYRKHPLVKHIIYNEENSGSPFIQWSRGISIATGSWIWIAESDDIADPGFLSAANSMIEKNNDLGIFYADSRCRAEDNRALRFKTYAEAKNKFFHNSKWSAPYTLKGEDEINESLKWVCTINNSSAAVFRKKFLLDILHKLETFIYHGDWYCQIAVACRGSVSYTPLVLNDFRLHSNSFVLQPNKLQSKLECFRILEFLSEHEFVKDKKKLIKFFTLQYLGFGFFTDGFGFGRNLFRTYAFINKDLARQVWRCLLRQKLAGKRRRVIF